MTSPPNQFCLAPGITAQLDDGTLHLRSTKPALALDLPHITLSREAIRNLLDIIHHFGYRVGQKDCPMCGLPIQPIEAKEK